MVAAQFCQVNDLRPSAVVDPDIQITGGGGRENGRGGYPDPEIRGRPGLPLGLS